MIVVGTDFHFGCRNDDEVFMERHFEYLENVFLPAVEQNKVTTFLHLGDLFDKRKIINIKTFDMVCERFFDKLKHINIVTLIGNHDIYYRNTNRVNSLRLLTGEYSNIHVVESFENMNIDGHRFGLMSWINRENAEEANGFIQTTDADILCGHFEIEGFEMMRGIRCEKGLKQDAFKRFRHVWSGHFHLRSKQGNIEYIGNPFDLTWADHNTEKGTFLFDSNGNRHYLDNHYRMFDIIQYNDDLVRNTDFADYKNKIVRVNVESLRHDNTMLNQFVSELQQYAYKVDINDVSELKMSDVSDAGITVESTIEKIHSTIDAMELNGLDKGRLKEYMRLIHDEAVERMEK